MRGLSIMRGRKRIIEGEKERRKKGYLELKTTKPKNLFVIDSRARDTTSICFNTCSYQSSEVIRYR